jgi:hypothetical protein
LSVWIFKDGIEGMDETVRTVIAYITRIYPAKGLRMLINLIIDS